MELSLQFCVAVSDFHIFDEDVKYVKREFSANALVHFILYVLKKFYSVV